MLPQDGGGGKLAIRDAPSKVQPSARTKMMSLTGNENIMGDTMIIPSDVKTLATAKSMAINGK